MQRREPATKASRILAALRAHSVWGVLALSLVLFATGLVRWLAHPLEVQQQTLVAGPASVDVTVVRLPQPPRVVDAGGADGGLGDGGAPPAPAIPAEGAKVTVFTESRERMFTRVAQAVTDQQGRARLQGLAPGPAWLLVEAPGSNRVSRRLVLGAPQQAHFQLQPAARLAISVVDDQEHPIAEATVLVADKDALPFGSLTSAQGRAEFTRLGTGAYAVDVYARGFEAAQRVIVDDDRTIVLRRLGGLGVTVLGSDGAPAAEAEVYIVGSSLWPARRVLTDAEGHAELGGLLAGVYDLRARKAGLVSPVESGVQLSRGERREVTLRLGGGRYVRVEVRGEKPLSRPIEGASLVVAEFGLSPFPLTARTDKEGHAAIGPLSPGPAFLSVRAKGYVGRAALPVPENLTERMRIVLAKGARLKGEVVDQHGHAIAGASVEVIGIGTDGQPIAETPLLAAYRDAHFDFAMKPLPLIPAGELGVTVGHVPYVNEARGQAGWTELPADYLPWITDVEGRFSAAPIPPGRVRALVRHPNYVEGLSDIVVLGSGGEATVTVVLREGGRLLGRVVDERGFPVPGVRVLVASESGSFERHLLSEVDGMFRIASVPERVIVSLARPEEPQRFVTREKIRVADGQEREREFVLPAPRPSIHWQVVDSDDKPIDLAQVTLTSLSADTPLRLTRFTSVEGELSIDDVAGLSVRVDVRAPGYVPISLQLQRAPEEKVLRLQRGLRLTGKITGVRGHVEVAGARVTLLAGSRKDSTTTNHRGDFELRQVPLGEVTLVVEHQDYAQASVAVTVEDTGREDRPFEVDPIDLEEGATLRGTVVDADGEPVSGARVGAGFVGSVRVRGALPPGVVLTGEDGSFVLNGVTPGVQQVHAVSAGAGRGVLQVQVEAGDDLSELILSLSEGDEELSIEAQRGGLAVTLGERDENVATVVLIVDVATASEAERAGLRRGDVILSVDGERVTSMGAARSLSNGRAGSDVVVRVRRDGDEQSYRVRREELSR